MRIPNTLNSTFRLALTFSAAAAIMPAAKADLTVVTETITTTDVSGASTTDVASGLGDFTKPLTLGVAYTKGKLSRYDTDKRIILRGLQAGTITILEPATKTFYVTTEDAEYARLNGGSPDDAKAISEASVNQKSDVHTLTAKRNILGLPTQGVTFDIAMKFKFPADTSDTPVFLKLNASGTMWSSDDLEAIPGDVSASHMPITLPKPIVAAMMKISDKFHGTALSSTLVIHLDGGDKTQLVKLQIVMRQDVRAISHAPLSDDLFRVPDGYMLTQPPGKPSTTAGALPVRPTPAS